MSDFHWTDDAVATLKRMLKDGHSSSRIALELGCSRNAVIGKRHRVGINAPAAPKRVHRAPPAKVIRAKKAPPPPAPRPPVQVTAPVPEKVKPNQALPESRRLSLIQLRASQCKWPLGDPQHADFCFCGADTGDVETVYCPTHHSLAYQPRGSQVVSR